MSLFNKLVNIREKAPFYSHAWSRKEQLANILLTTVFAERYKLYVSIRNLRIKNADLKREIGLYRVRVDNLLRIHANGENQV